VRRARGPDALTVALAVLAALAGGGAAFGALSALSAPAGVEARAQRVEQIAARVGSSPPDAGNASAYAAHALCRGPTLQAADTLRGRLAAAADAAGLANPRITVAPPDPEAGGRLKPARFQIEAAGGYEAMLGFMRTLDQGEPEVFADTFDLSSAVSSVTFKLTGRVLCSTPG
jgi:hypothetical protein